MLIITCSRAILPSHYKVKEYCPLVFKNIRERFNISEDAYLKSLTRDGMEPLEDTSSKSNAKFYRSYDKRYIIKTITSEDVEGLHSILIDYHKVSGRSHVLNHFPWGVLKNFFLCFSSILLKQEETRCCHICLDYSGSPWRIRRIIF